ncbi:saccharopine dehydrogenase family protein [Knoellia sp. Soil729]|uniref:saccharopine dehydrogenase family protein n=1 Tax=Knoellia sp. Soil729 TaxID=1736394 RepID=UPI0006F4FF2C|nr:saccharopine dehydrogenase NADP-binding domain-containing protein [Knoellia sp. Soil729]KRE40380.1 enoyl-ACP reductase [Knoellia sp. Soil729]
MSPTREFDLVLVGATGFVGRLTAAHLAEHAPTSVRIALAGRSESRLADVRSSLPDAAADWPLLVVDTTDSAAVADLAARTRVVVTTVGPYAKLGMPLASACAAAGTHYADLTGEVLFVRDSIEANHAEAERTGAKIVHSCGFDSIPSDLGVWKTAQRVAADGEGTLGETLLHVRTLRGGVSGGTIDSMRQQAIESGADPARRRAVSDPYGLSPDREAEPPSRNRPSGPKPSGIAGALSKAQALSGTRFDEVTQRWVAPFFMASFNTRIVRRSNALTHWSYGREFRYDEVMDTGRGSMGAVKAGLTSAVLGGLFAGMSTAPTRSVLDRVLPKPGEGPSEDTQAKGRFVMEVETTATTGARYRTKVAAPYDPGYSGTAIMLGQAGLSLVQDELDPRGGVLTPAVALGDALVGRLEGFDFEFCTIRR